MALALTCSSAIISVKLLSDKRELDSLHGRIAVGFLIVQDFAVVIGMMVMSGLGGMLTLLARSQELRLIFAIAWDAALAVLGETAGFSPP